MNTTASQKGVRSAYLSIVAQSDNLGDIAIRQAAIDILSAGNRIIVLVGNMPSDYVSAFRFPVTSRLISSSLQFQLMFWRDSLARRAHLVFAPGPYQIRSGIRPALKAAMNLVNIVVARLSGGQVIALGRAIRGQGRPSVWIERIAARMYTFFVARDSVSSAVIGRRLEIAPDLAFSRELDFSESVRDRVAFVLRGDRPLNLVLLSRLVELVRSAGLSPVFVTQVARDERRHSELAARFGAELVAWDGNDHGSQIATVEGTYRACRYVVSDRLHALILGMLKGALPVALQHESSDKLTSTLDTVAPFKLIEASASHVEDEMFMDGDQSQLVEHLKNAQLGLATMSERVRRLLSV